MANQLVNAQLFKEGVDSKLGLNRKLAQFVEVESVEGLQVGKFNIVTNQYIGDAEVVPAGTQIPLTDLVQDTKEVSFEKIAKGVAVTDEEKKQTFGDPVGNAENQTVKAIDGKAEAKVADLLKTAKFTVEAEALNSTAILDAIAVMGEGIEDAPYFLVVTPATYAELQKELGQNFVLNNNPFGAEFVMSTRIEEGVAYLVQEGAIKEVVQKGTDVEVERNAGKKQDEIYTDRIHAVYIQDESKLVRISVAGAGA